MATKLVKIFYSLHVWGTACKNGHLTLIYGYVFLFLISIIILQFAFYIYMCVLIIVVTWNVFSLNYLILD